MSRAVVLIASDGTWREVVVNAPMVRMAVSKTVGAVYHDAWDQRAVPFEVEEYLHGGLEDERGLDVLTPNGGDVPFGQYPFRVFRVGETAWVSVWVSDLQRDCANKLGVWTLAKPAFRSIHDSPVEWRIVGVPRIDSRDESIRATKYIVCGQAITPVNVEAVA